LAQLGYQRLNLLYSIPASRDAAFNNNIHRCTLEEVLMVRTCVICEWNNDGAEIDKAKQGGNAASIEVSNQGCNVLVLYLDRPRWDDRAASPVGAVQIQRLEGSRFVRGRWSMGVG